MAKKKAGPEEFTLSRVTQGDLSVEKPLEVGGWYDGKGGTYLWIGQRNGGCYGHVGGAELLKMARRIVREFEK